MRGHIGGDRIDLDIAVDDVRALAEPGVSVAAEQEVIDRRDVIDAREIQRRAGDRRLEDALAGVVQEAVDPLPAADLQPARSARCVLEHLLQLCAGEVDIHDRVLERQHLVELAVRHRARLERRADAGGVVEGDVGPPSLLPAVLEDPVSDHVPEAALISRVVEIVLDRADDARGVLLGLRAA